MLLPKTPIAFVISVLKSRLNWRIVLLCVLLSCKSFGQCGGCCLTGCADPTHFACLGDCNCYLISPILVDTTGKGFHLTSADAGVLFDMAGDGQPMQIAWTATGSGNAFLALDRNHNGKIDNGKELFGNFTEQPPCSDGGTSCLNGYRALAEFDNPQNGGNGDGVIDKRDNVFRHLLLWIDENHDGISQPKELHTLEEMGVFSIGLRYRNDRHFIDEYGNWFHYRGALNPDPTDGESEDGRWTYDVFFEVLRPAFDIRDALRFLPEDTRKPWADFAEAH